MTLSPEELTILHSIAQTVTNTTTYGYDIAVEGTIYNGVANLIGLSFVLAATYISAVKLNNWNKSNGMQLDIIIGGVIIFLLFCAYVLIAIILEDSIIAICAPEYVVVKGILSSIT